MKKNNGISLISLVITIIVIIILASIVIFTGLNTPDRAGFAKFASETDDFQIAFLEQFTNTKSKGIIDGKRKTDAQVYYAVATGTDISSVSTNPTATGSVSSVSVQPEGLKGVKFYEITNGDIWATNRTYYSDTEKHYITDKGEIFMLPGYLVEENGTDKWYVNSKKYYTGEPKDPSTIVASSEDLDDLITYFVGKNDSVWWDATNDTYKDMEPITNASTSIVDILWDGDDKCIIMYNGVYYKVTYNTSTWNVISVSQVDSYYALYKEWYGKNYLYLKNFDQILDITPSHHPVMIIHGSSEEIDVSSCIEYDSANNCYALSISALDDIYNGNLQTFHRDNSLLLSQKMNVVDMIGKVLEYLGDFSFTSTVYADSNDGYTIKLTVNGTAITIERNFDSDIIK